MGIDNFSSIKRSIYPRKYLNNYIQSQIIQKLTNFHGNLRITQMNGGIEPTSYFPFPLNQ